MKVKVGQLKTHLSRYLKTIRDGGEPIEVCVREDTVAYLTSPNDPSGARPMPQSDLELARQLEADGLAITHWGRKPRELPVPGRCTRPAHGSNSVESMRAERSW